jgi:hypothetical protein
MSFLLLRDDQRLQPGTVSGSVDTDFVAGWLIDGRPSFPVKTTGDLDLTATPPAPINADLFAVINHTITAANSAVLTRNGGTAVGSLVVPTWGEDGIPLNPFLKLAAPVSVTSLRIQVSGNTGAVVIAGLYAGPATELTTSFLFDETFDPGVPFEWESLMAPTDDGLGEPRRTRGTMILTNADFALLQSAYRASRKGTRPTLIVPDTDANDAWLAQFQYTDNPKEGYHFVTMEMMELPRTRW